MSQCIDCPKFHVDGVKPRERCCLDGGSTERVHRELEERLRYPNRQQRRAAERQGRR